MRSRVLFVLLLVLCAGAAWCQGPMLISSNPSNGSTVTSAVSQITLTFDSAVLPAGVALYRYGAPVSGIVTASSPAAGPANSLTFTPIASPLEDGQYMIDLRGVQGPRGLTIRGSTTVTFTQNTGSLVRALTGSAQPQVVTLSAGQVVGVSYLIRNSSNQQITLQSSSAEFVINGATVATVNVPANISISAQSLGVLPSNAAISDQIQNAARTAGTDEVLMVRTFTTVGLPAAGSQQVSIPLIIKIGNNMAAAASVTSVLVDVPANGRSVQQSDAIRGHAFIRGTGTGPIAGTWFVDGQPVETFQANMTAGLTQEVRTRLTLPTLELGPHNVVLQITRPALLYSNTQTYMVLQNGVSSQRVFLTQPSDELSMSTDAVHTSFRWVPVPGASGYEIALARDLSGLGLDKDGKPISSLLELQTWTKQMVESGKLIYVTQLPADALAWTPTEDEFSRISASSAGKVAWAVRAIYPAQAHGDPTTTSKPRSILLLPPPAKLVLITPEDSAKLSTASPKFAWQSDPAAANYEFVIMSQGRNVFRALTRTTHYDLSELSAFKLTPGDYSWRVSAVKAGAGVVSASGRSTFVVGGGAVASNYIRPTSAQAQPTLFIATGGVVGALLGAAPQITLTPADGSVVQNQQPVISATYPEAKSDGVLLTLNGVDVTSLAEVRSTSLTLQPPGVFSGGVYTLALVVATADGQKIQASSKFTVSAPTATQTASGGVNASTGAEHVNRPLQLGVNWDWNGSNNASASDSLTLDVNLHGQQNWDSMGGSSAAINAQLTRPMGDKFDLSSLLAETSVHSDAYRLMAGDVGSSGSQLTTQGSTYREFSLIGNAGPVKLTAAHTLGQALQSSSIGSTPDMFLVTAESAKSTPDRGFNMSYVDSNSTASADSSFESQTTSKVLSLGGRTPLGKTGLHLKADIANSDSTTVSSFGSQTQSGKAMNASIDGTILGFGVSTNYRTIGSDYASPSSTTLTSDLKGWTFALNRPFGKHVNTNLNYSMLNNGSNSSAPASSIISKSLGISLAYPNLPSITFQVSRNDSSADAFTSGTLSTHTQENVWSATANYTKTIWDAYLSYSKSDFADLVGVQDPLVDIPNDHGNGTFAFGCGIRPSKALHLRFDWGTNDSNLWYRPLLTTTPVQGVDRSNQFKAELEYLINNRFSSTLALSNSLYTDALGLNNSTVRDLSFQLNYFLKVNKSGGGITIAGEWNHSNLDSSVFGGGPSAFSVLVNDNRVLDF